jgi:hypothetical protein
MLTIARKNIRQRWLKLLASRNPTRASCGHFIAITLGQQCCLVSFAPFADDQILLDEFSPMVLIALWEITAHEMKLRTCADISDCQRANTNVSEQ